MGDIIYTAHGTKIGGHWDAEKTLDRIRRVYWWISVRRDVNEHIQGCDRCQRTKGPKAKAELRAPLKPLEISERFNECVQADLLGPLKSSGPNKYVLVMLDSFTKWLELIPIPDKSAETVAHAIHTGWICRNAPMAVSYTHLTLPTKA